jgi:quercetin dioxygenase-like cupin family protein
MDRRGSETVENGYAGGVTRRTAIGRIVGGGIAVALAVTGGLGIPHVRARQDPSMPPGSTGITPQPLGGGLPSVAPGYAMGLVRLTYAPGGTLNSHTHPGASILYVESGTLTYTLIAGTATVTRSAADASTPPAAEPLGMGEVVLNAGDSLFEDADVVHTARNDGDEPAVVLIANLLTAGAPVTTFLEGTPVP